jgi:hypothetical protein
VQQCLDKMLPRLRVAKYQGNNGLLIVIIVHSLTRILILVIHLVSSLIEVFQSSPLLISKLLAINYHTLFVSISVFSKTI